MTIRGTYDDFFTDDGTMLYDLALEALEEERGVYGLLVPKGPDTGLFIILVSIFLNKLTCW